METPCPICGNWTHEGWIDVDEHLPKDGVIVIGITLGGVRCFDAVTDGEWECKIFDSLENSGETMDKEKIYTHWIKVPDLPEINKD